MRLGRRPGRRTTHTGSAGLGCRDLESIRIISGETLLLMIAIPLKTFAEDAAKPSPAQIANGQSKAGVANALIILGRSAKDPDMLMTAAKILAAIDAPIADPKASSDGKPVFYDVDAIVAEADSYAANRAAKPASRTTTASPTTNIGATA